MDKKMINFNGWNFNGMIIKKHLLSSAKIKAPELKLEKTMTKWWMNKHQKKKKCSTKKMHATE